MLWTGRDTVHCALGKGHVRVHNRTNVGTAIPGLFGGRIDLVRSLVHCCMAEAHGRAVKYIEAPELMPRADL